MGKRRVQSVALSQNIPGQLDQRIDLHGLQLAGLGTGTVGLPTLAFAGAIAVRAGVVVAGAAAYEAIAHPGTAVDSDERLQLSPRASRRRSRVLVAGQIPNTSKTDKQMSLFMRAPSLVLREHFSCKRGQKSSSSPACQV